MTCDEMTICNRLLNFRLEKKKKTAILSTAVLKGGEILGFYIRGYFIGMEQREFENQDGTKNTRFSLNVATGNLAYRVYMSDDFIPDEVEGMKVGQEVLVSVRVYVSKNGKLSCVDGRIESVA